MTEFRDESYSERRRARADLYLLKGMLGGLVILFIAIFLRVSFL